MYTTIATQTTITVSKSQACSVIRLRTFNVRLFMHVYRYMHKKTSIQCLSIVHRTQTHNQPYYSEDSMLCVSSSALLQRRFNALHFMISFIIMAQIQCPCISQSAYCTLECNACILLCVILFSSHLHNSKNFLGMVKEK